MTSKNKKIEKENWQPYCLSNAIETPDGTILQSKNEGDSKTHIDQVSQENYVNAGIGFIVKRTNNKTEYKDLSTWSHQKIEVVRERGLYIKGIYEGTDLIKDIPTSTIQEILRQNNATIKSKSIEVCLTRELIYRLKQKPYVKKIY